MTYFSGIWKKTFCSKENCLEMTVNNHKQQFNVSVVMNTALTDGSSSSRLNWTKMFSDKNKRLIFGVENLIWLLFIYHKKKKKKSLITFVIKYFLNVVDQRFHEHKELFEAQWELYVYHEVQEKVDHFSK